MFGEHLNIQMMKFVDSHTVDGRNPTNQLRLVVYHIIYNVLAPSQVVGLGISEPSTVGFVFFWAVLIASVKSTKP